MMQINTLKFPVTALMSFITIQSLPVSCIRHWNVPFNINSDLNFENKENLGFEFILLTGTSNSDVCNLITFPLFVFKTLVFLFFKFVLILYTLLVTNFKMYILSSLLSLSKNKREIK